MIDEEAWPKEYALTPLCEELLAYTRLPWLTPERFEAMTGPERAIVVEFVRFLEHRERTRDGMLMAAMGMKR